MDESDGKSRCFGNGQQLYADYHDNEWGIAVHDDRKLFETLVLDGAQAGLSWFTILKKRPAYREAFHNFEPQKVAAMTDTELDELLGNRGIVRNRLKIYAARKNAIVFIKIQQQYQSFDDYLWQFVEGTTIANHWQKHEDVPVTTAESDALSKDLKSKGMAFVGSIIIYAYMQAIGMVNDHLTSCWKYGK